MEYIITLLLGIILGVLLLYILKPSYFNQTKTPDFTSLEVMFEQFIDEMDNKQEQFRQEIAEKETALKRLQMEIERSVKDSTVSPKVLKVQSLYEEGHGVQEIAQKLGIGQGEVELILNLEKQKTNLD